MPDSLPPPRDPDRNLLVGVLALQLDFIAREDLLGVLAVWTGDRTRSLGQLLVEAHALAAHRLPLLEELAGECLARHNGDVSAALAAMCQARSVYLDLAEVTTDGMHSSMPTLPSAPPTYSRLNTLDAPPAAVAVTATSSRRFRIVRPHANGAIGQVYVAVDEELHREVALKEMREPYAHVAECRARFVLEAEVTGSLEHPGIVPVYSLGRHPDGRPYYAMRFIRGQSLHEAIAAFHKADETPGRDMAERGLALRGLLTRFVAVCNAIAYAHSRGVMHRDIKPSNVMLGPFGETLVVDWGLAKTMGGPATDSCGELPIKPVSALSTHPTVLGQAVGTPSFMPPEQAAGRVDDVGLSSDIYSLGATLYQLLTGVPPFQGATVEEILKRVQSHLFPAPRKLKANVPPALEAIVLKAMAYRPVYRYQTAHEIAQEVERWLADEPVRAYREPVGERALRWTRRHRPLVAGVAVLLLTTVVGLAGGLYAVGREQERTARERDQARQNLELAEHNLGLARDAVDKCFVLATEHPLLQQDKMRAVRKLLLERALPFYQGFRAQKPDDSGISFEDANNHFKVAVITAEIGRKSEALESYARAQDGMQALVDAHPAADGYRADLARIANNRGVLERETGLQAKAEESLQLARRLRADLADRHPATAEYQSDLASTHNNLGVLDRDRGQPQEALEHFEQARQLLDRLAATDPKQIRYQVDLAATLHNLGRLQAEAGEPHEAAASYEQARAIRERLVKSDASGADRRAELASTLTNLGALRHIDAAKQAEDCYQQARTLLEALVRDYPDVSDYQMDLARACNNLGVLLRRPGQTAESVRLHRRALELLEGLVGKNANVPDYRVALAGTCLDLGHTLRDAPPGPEVGPAEALPWYDRAIKEVTPVRAADPQSADAVDLLAKAHWGRAEALGKLRRHRDALPDWQKALELSRGDDRELIRQDRAFALALAGDHAAALAEVDDLLKGRGVNGRLLYNLACVTTLAAAALARDEARPEAVRAREADELATRAVELLQRARLARLFKDQSRVEHLRKDPDLDFLRNRADYRELEKELLALPPGKP
ncbi:MAG: serine/threonine-protein kinase [Gemmataceae bacterium]